MDLGMIALLVIVLWIASMGIYIRVSRGQGNLQSGIESLQQTLGEQISDEE